MNRTAVLAAGIALGAALLGLGLWYGSQRHDGFDYEAAFENLPEIEVVGATTDLPAFAGKPREEAEVVLGQPQDCEASLHSERCRYAGRVEIVYIDGRADWITVQFPYGRYPLAPETLARLGLPVAPPQETAGHRLHWRALANLREVVLVGDDNGATYARIKVIHG